MKHNEERRTPVANTYPGFKPATCVSCNPNPKALLEHNTLTMNSVTALMTSHTIVNPKALLEHTLKCKPEDDTTS
jgi:hypothetical protein